jgi:magnesium transporter
LRDLVVAEPDALIADCMRQDVAFVRLDDSKDEVARKLIHYNLLAVPVVDEHGHLKGVVTVDDVMDIVTPRAWQNRPRRMTG